ncbi:MAG: isoprenylcysteine carboxylmethyltransferase family protein [Verrucomicrobiia bacterium]
MATISGPVIVGCWVIFIAYWLISAFGQKATAEQKSFLSSLPYRLPLTLGGLLLWYPRFPYPLNLALTPHTDPARVMGAVVCVFGLLVTLWSRWTLGGNWSSEVAFKQGHKLVKTGPYRFARHPIYTGLLLMCLGTAVVVGQFHSWLGFLLLCVGFWIKLKQEEALMLQHFPDEYPAYQKLVKALVPFVI